jgi:hypothetical protein
VFRMMFNAELDFNLQCKTKICLYTNGHLNSPALNLTDSIVELSLNENLSIRYFSGKNLWSSPDETESALSD